MSTVLITGANGFVGHNIVEQLLLKKYKVIATGKGPNRWSCDNAQFSYETMDFTEAEHIKAVFEKYVPDIIVHCGALPKPDECEQNKEAAFRINVSGTIYLLNEAAKYGCFFIFLSTDFIFSGEEGMYKEEDTPAPVNYYGQTKLLAEGEVKKYPFPWTIVRTVLVYGPSDGGRLNMVTMVADALHANKTLHIYDDQVRTPTYVADLAKAIATIIDKRATGVYHISGKDVRTPYQIACAVARYLGFDDKKINRVTAETFIQGAKRPPKTGFSIEKAKRELNYQPVSFDDGLSLTLKNSKYFTPNQENR
ncbi:MAG: SDR family oxidoreductase [Flavisolibacter sp.]|nr:SDR family oxidoreductase [Flavisolibacter sp.]